ncbi:MAG: hypothetical protein GEV07_20940 [Streptosporangiales bacterium]|nr:hypothetical protein [Streptosporangiales bacterium]
MSLYVETLIRADLDLIWHRTQDPSQHERWDLRFTEISYLPRPAPHAPQRFRYATRLLPGLVVGGTGIAAGERFRADGTRTSVLRFRSPHPLALLAHGHGYWRYVPTAAGVRFLTGYDYAPRWGRFGRLADRLVLRPLMGWATAWSFDRLRLWCERGITPARALRNGLLELALRAAVIAVAAWCLPYAPAVAAVALAAAAVLPPLPGTPAARRCLCRKQPAPNPLTRLEHP